jgi:hypothetical protein
LNLLKTLFQKVPAIELRGMAMDSAQIVHQLPDNTIVNDYAIACFC